MHKNYHDIMDVFREVMVKSRIYLKQVVDERAAGNISVADMVEFSRRLINVHYRADILHTVIPLTYNRLTGPPRSGESQLEKFEALEKEITERREAYNRGVRA